MTYLITCINPEFIVRKSDFLQKFSFFFLQMSKFTTYISPFWQCLLFLKIIVFLSKLTAYISPFFGKKYDFLKRCHFFSRKWRYMFWRFSKMFVVVQQWWQALVHGFLVTFFKHVSFLPQWQHTLVHYFLAKHFTF